MTFLRKMRLRQKLTSLLLVIGLIPTLLVSVIAYITISGQQTSKTKDQLVSIAIKQEQKINTLLQSRQEEVLKLANRYDLQAAISASKTGGPSQAGAIGAVLRERKTEIADVQAIYLTNLSGVIIGTTVSGEQGQTMSVTDYDAKAGQLNSVRVLEDPKDHIEKLYIATRMNVNRQEIGTLTLVFQLDDIIGATQDYTGLGNTGETVVSIQDETRAISLFPLRFDENASLSTDLSRLNLIAAPDQVLSEAVDYRGHQVLLSSRSIASADWVLATKIDAAEVEAPINQLRNTLTLIMLGSSIAILLIALAFSRFLLAPIAALTEKTRNIMLGNFAERIAVTSSDEVGVLATAFNKMTDELAASYQALEDKVAMRTQALNQKLQELSDAKAKDDAILGSMGEGMIVTDSTGRVTLLNQLAGDLLGLNASAMVGSMLADMPLYDEKDQPIPASERPVEVALRTGEKAARDIKAAQTSGQNHMLSITATPVLQQGKIIGTVQIIRDVTQEKEVDRMKTEFISLASHQLRTPLSAIRWFSEMLLSGDAGSLQPEQVEFAQNISDSTDRMIQLVNSLLNISRIESGRIIVAPKPTDLKELISGITQDMHAKIEERKQNMVISVHDDLPKINLDPHLIGQVYLNLLSNAVKYTQKGGEISVMVSRKGDEVVSQVTDNGYGIPLAQQHKLFQKFFRADNAIKVETDGNGLGLYLVKSIIESSGGKIWYKSEEGKGTTFWFSLPMSGMKTKAGEVTLDE